MMRSLLSVFLLVTVFLSPVFAQFGKEDLAALELEGPIRAYKELGISLGLGGYYGTLGLSIHCNINRNLSIRVVAGAYSAGGQLRWMFSEDNLSPFMGIGYLGTEKEGVKDTFEMLSFGIEIMNTNGTTIGIEVNPVFLGEEYSSDRALYSIEFYVGYFF